MSTPAVPKNKSSNSKEEKELIIKERDHTTISFWWQAFQVLFYFASFSGGICTSIALGNISTAFEPYCILHANLTITNIDDIPPVLDFRGDEVYRIYTHAVNIFDILDIEWGNPNGCLFCTFSPAAQAVFAFMWGALFLQCGKGGKNFMNDTQSWRIVAPAIFFTTGLFIVSCVSLSMITTGLSSFCQNILHNSADYTNLTSCGDVFSLRFPWNETGIINLYTNYVLARVGSIVVFMGYLLALLLLLLRCIVHVDFVILQRKIISRRPENQSMPNPSGSSQGNQHTKLRSSSSSNSDDSENENVDVKNKSYEDKFNSNIPDTTTVPLISRVDENIAKKVK